ncbi:MAG: hypothetical protein ABIG96_01810 [Candidatus Micrarchaeota archaeon]
MDFFAHLAWTYLLFFRSGADLNAALFFGIFPDVLFVSAAIIYSINLFARSREISRQKLFPVVRKVYLVAHSAVTATIFGIIASLLTGTIYLPVFAWYLHIALDIYTHKGSPAEPQMPLYPIRKPAIKGWIWWRNPYFLIVNWFAVIIAYFLLNQ